MRYCHKALGSWRDPTKLGACTCERAEAVEGMCMDGGLYARHPQSSVMKHLPLLRPTSSTPSQAKDLF